MFDDDGRMIIALKDRSSDIMMRMAAPDMLIACPTPRGYQMENRGRCGGHTGAMPIAKTHRDPSRFGFGGGQYFNVTGTFHDYNVAYGVAKAGPNKIIATGLDYATTREGSARWYNADTGKVIKGYSIYRTAIYEYTFDKANGLGSIAAAYPPSMEVVECGRVWFDCNGNGIQDCNEPGIPNIKVFLFYSDNPTCPVTYAYTDANGYFRFSILPGKQYSCLIHADEIRDKFGDFNLSPALNDSRYEGIDSDAKMVGDNLVSSMTSAQFSGYFYNHCHFGIIRPSKLPRGGYGHWGGSYGGRYRGSHKLQLADSEIQDEQHEKWIQSKSQYTYSIFEN